MSSSIRSPGGGDDLDDRVHAELEALACPHDRRRMLRAFHGVRGLVAGAGVVICLTLWVAWTWAAGLVVAGLALVAFFDAILRRKRDLPLPWLPFVIDSILIYTGLMLAGVPTAAFGVAFAQGATAAILLLPIGMGVAVVGFSAGGLAVAATHVIPPLEVLGAGQATVLGAAVGTLFGMGLVGQLIAFVVAARRDQEGHEYALTVETAIGECSRLLLMDDLSDEPLRLALEALLKASDADFCYVDENYQDVELGLCARIMVTAEKPGSKAHLDSGVGWVDGPYSELPTYLDALSLGNPLQIIVTDLEGRERQIMVDDGALSELCIPIHIGAEWVGSIAFTDYLVPRVWSAGEIDTLVTAANLVGAFWSRRRAMDHLGTLASSNDDLIAAVSHEIRTPLTSVLGIAEELRDHIDVFDDAEASEFAGLIASQALEVSHLVEDLLVAARGSDLVVRTELVDLAVEGRLAASVVSQARGVVPAEVEGAVPPAIGDPTRVRQIVRNLLANARIHGGEAVRMEASASDGVIRLAVCDDGAGLPDDRIEEAFLPFERVDPELTQPASVGIGLSVSRNLARLMGGDLAYARDGGVTRFTLTLPGSPKVVPAARAAH